MQFLKNLIFFVNILHNYTLKGRGCEHSFLSRSGHFIYISQMFLKRPPTSLLSVKSENLAIFFLQKSGHVMKFLTMLFTN